MPLAVIVFCYTNIYRVGRKSNRSLAGNGSNDATSQSKLEKEKKLATSLFIMIAVYIAAWTPYAIVTMWATFGDASVIPPPALGFPAVLAKTSMMLNPAVYVLTCKIYRERIKKMYKIRASKVQPIATHAIVVSTAQSAPSMMENSVNDPPTQSMTVENTNC